MVNYLFLCHANIVRSQMAEGFGKMGGLDVMSAGVETGRNTHRLSGYSDFVRCMEEVSYFNLGSHVQKQLTPKMIEWADRIIVLGVEENYWPDYLKQAKDKIVFHNVDDPGFGNERMLCRIRDQIRDIVEKLEK